MQHNNSPPSSDQVQEHDVRVDGDVVPVHVVRDGARGEEGQLQGARQRGPIRDTDRRMGKPLFLWYRFLSPKGYRVTHQVVQNETKVPFWPDLPWPGQAEAELLF